MKTIETLTWEQVILRGFEVVTVESYGYEEVHIYGSHFEPFSKKRSFQFHIFIPEGEGIPNPDDCFLMHDWLNLEERESDLRFELREDGYVYLNDPDLFENASASNF